MTHRALFLAVALVTAIAPSTARAQVIPSKTTPDENTVALQKKAIKLVESIAEQVSSLQSHENRARIGSNIANLLWEHDEKRSRDLMRSVTQDLRTWANEIESDESDAEGQMRELGVFSKLRSDIIQRLAKRDLEAALEFLRATRLAVRADVTEKKPQPYEQFIKPDELERMLELQLAQQATAKNPKFALQLGREIINKNLSSDVLPLLQELNRKDPAGANSFYKMLVDQLRESQLEAGSRAADLSFELARAFRPPVVDEQVYRNLLGLVLVAAANSGCGEQESESPTRDCYQIGVLLPALEKYYGPRTASLKRWALSADELERREGWDRAQEVMETGTVDEIINLAREYPAMGTSLHWAAIVKAEREGDLARAQQIAEGNSDLSSRQSMLNHIDELKKFQLMNTQKMAALQQTLSEIQSDEQRLAYLFEVARQLAETDRKAALSLLDQVNQIVERTKSTKVQIYGQVGSALMYSFMKSDRGFPILESLLPRLNDLVAASIQLDGLDISYVRNGEWNMSSEGSVGGLLVMLAQNAEYFARIDFDRSVALTNQLQRSELRLMAQEKIAQGILAPMNSLSVKVTPPVPLDSYRVHQIRDY